MTKRDPFKYFKTSPEIIRLAEMMYVRYPLSLQNVEDLLHERGIDVSHETVRFWWNRFGPSFAAEIRRKRVQRLRAHSNWQWHLDEVFVKINGETHCLWRAVDHEGEVLESYVTKRRDRKAALKFLRKTIAPRIPTCRFDAEGEPCCASAEREVCKSSSPSTPQFTTISTWKDISTHVPISSLTARTLSLSGVNSVRHNTTRHWPFRDWFAFV